MTQNEKVIEKVRKVAHDIKSPVVSMQSFLNLIELSDYDLDKEELMQLCTAMKNSLEKTMNTLENEIDELKELLL